MATDWEMPKRGLVCAACNHEFDPGEAILACLHDTPDGYARRDYCDKCAPPAEPPAVGTWKTIRPLPIEKKQQTFDQESIQKLFEQLEDADAPAKLRLRFVLALLLWRKKVLKFDASHNDDEGEVWRFHATRTDATYDVRRPDLDEERLEHLGLQLESLLTGGSGEIEALVADADGECDDAQE